MKKYVWSLLLLVMSSFANALWLPGYGYRQEITISGQAGAGVNYPVRLDIGAASGGDFHLSGHAAHFPYDIAFTVSDGTTTLSSWFEDTSSTSTVTAWVKVTDDLASDQIIYCYYGKSSVTEDLTEGAKVFEEFEDFNGPRVLNGIKGVLVSSGGAVLNAETVDPAGYGFEAWDILTVEDTQYLYVVEFATWPAGQGTRVWVATAPLDGSSWSWYSGNPIFEPSPTVGRFDHNSIDGYSVIYSTAFPDFSYLMAYSALASPQVGAWPTYDSPYQIGFATATSPFGPWTRYSGEYAKPDGVVISTTTAAYENGHVLGPKMRIKNGKLHIFYHAINTSNEWSVAHATATLSNPFNVSKDPANPIISSSNTWEGGAGAALVYYDLPPETIDGVDYFFYTGRTGGFAHPEASKVGYATSTDPELSTWTKYAGNPIMSDAYSFCPIMRKIDGRWRLYYVIGSNPMTNYQMYQGVPSTVKWVNLLGDATGLVNMADGTFSVHGHALGYQAMTGTNTYGDYVIRGRTRGAGDYSYFGFMGTSPSVSASAIVGVSPNMGLYSFKTGSFTGTMTALPSNTWFTGEVRTVKGASDKMYDVDGNLLATNTTNVRTIDLPVYMGTYSAAGVLDVDWLAVRKTLAADPAFESGGAEEKRRASQILLFE